MHKYYWWNKKHKKFINKKIDNNFKVDIKHKNIFWEDVKLFLRNEIKDTNYIKNIKENKDLKKYLEDEKIFEFIRSILIAHPLNTSRHFKCSSNYFEKLISPFVYIDKHIFNT